MPAKDGFILTAGDIELVHLTHQLHIATLDHLAGLTGRAYKRTYRRVAKLEERRYLDRITKRPEKGIYRLGTEGVALLIEHGYAPQTLAQQRPRQQELTDLGRRHTLFIADIHAKLILLAKNNPVKPVHWQHDSAPLWDQVRERDARGRETAYAIRPDAYFILEDERRPAGRNRLHYFLEADRSTMSHERMLVKVRGYVAYHHQELYKQRHPSMQAFQVLTVTATPERAAKLAADILPQIAPNSVRKAYRFIAFQDLTIELLLPEN